MISVIDWLFGSTLEINTDTFWMTRVALKSMDYRHQHSFFFPSPFFCFTRCICLVTELNKMFISQISRAWCAYVSVTFAPFQVSCHALQLRQCSVSSRKSVTPRSSIPPPLHNMRYGPKRAWYHLSVAVLLSHMNVLTQTVQRAKLGISPMIGFAVARYRDRFTQRRAGLLFLVHISRSSARRSCRFLLSSCYYGVWTVEHKCADGPF